MHASRSNTYTNEYPLHWKSHDQEIKSTNKYNNGQTFSKHFANFGRPRHKSRPLLIHKTTTIIQCLYIPNY